MLSVSASIEKSWSGCTMMTVAQRDDLRAAYRTATPFPHLVIDALFTPEGLRPLIADFDVTPSESWQEIQSGLQKKRATLPDAPLPAEVQAYFNLVNSGPFIRFLSDVTGIENLIPDPALHGGGMHEVGEGGAFEIHLDFERHPRTALDNRLVVITYLNDDWLPSDGGALELWRMNPPERAATIEPVFGRTVIMEQSRLAAHGHPMPIRQGRKRRSVTAYFYTNGEASKTSSNRLPTTYIAHKGYTLGKRTELGLRLVIPPIVLMSLKTVRTVARGALGRLTPANAGRRPSPATGAGRTPRRPAGS